MNNEISCGSSCVRYILNELLDGDISINENMFWTTELAICLNKKLKSEVILYCYKSNLLRDYKKNLNSSYSGFVNIKKYINLCGTIKQRKLKSIYLKKEIDSSKFIILCVESRLLNNDSSMHGGHYVIILSRIRNDVLIVNPRKNEYEYKKIKISKLIKMAKNFGSWRILIK